MIGRQISRGRFMAGVLFLALLACARSPAGAPVAEAKGAAPSQKAEGIAPPSENGARLLQAVLDCPEQFESRVVTLPGSFAGWRGPCQDGPPVSRSDWMLTGGSGCLYVHGPLPRGLDPARPGNEKLSVTGVVRLKQGRPYLDASEGRVSPQGLRN